MKENYYDVVIIGGGVTGTAILYMLSKYTNVKHVALVEKYGKLAQVSSKKSNNSQTLHFGDIETNYTVEKARKVKEAADLVAGYVEKNDHGLYKKFSKMVLAVGEKEVQELAARYEDFKKVFPKLKKIGKNEIAKLEPNIVKGRNPDEELLALYSPDGFAVDYGRLSESFVENAVKVNKQADVFLSTTVEKIIKEGNGYDIVTDKGTLHAKVVVAAAAGHSLLFAYQLGYGKDFIVLPVAGSFFCANKLLNGKVYTMQLEKLPFAAIHGDPDVGNPNETRFGPTAKVIPMLERYNYSSVFDFFKLFEFRLDAVLSIFNILSDKIIFKYILRNFIYDMPFIGKRMFIKEVRKIVPSVKLKALKFGKGIGGIRPQIVDTKKRSMAMGEAKITGDNIIFNITPSPGASTCLNNAVQDTRQVVSFLGKHYTFKEKTFRKDVKR